LQTIQEAQAKLKAINDARQSDVTEKEPSRELAGGWSSAVREGQVGNARCSWHEHQIWWSRSRRQNKYVEQGPETNLWKF